MSAMDMKTVEMEVMKWQAVRSSVQTTSTYVMITNVSHQTGFVTPLKTVTMEKMKKTAITMRGNVICIRLGVHIMIYAYPRVLCAMATTTAPMEEMSSIVSLLPHLSPTKSFIVRS